MILERKTDTILLEEGEAQETTEMVIDAESHVFLMRMLSKFYSDGIGSLIRETASNALDSHRQSGVNEPIIVSFKKNRDGNYEFSVQDFGCGLDADSVENIIKKYGKSTKRNDPKALGAYGLGFKSPLAYTSAFYFIGRKNGIERKWMLYESDDETNKIDLLYESPTTERNGVKVIVPVKYSDYSEFLNKIQQQLAYFESVYFDCDGYINNNFKIIRNEHFQWSSLIKTDKLHICLDNVYYPIDFDKLGIRPISFPVGLRFSLSDGLYPVPNREQLKYPKETKDIIIAKIKLIAEYFVSKYNESIKDTDDVFQIFDYYSLNDRLIDHPSGVGKLNVRSLEGFSSIPFSVPKLKEIKLIDMKRIHDVRECLLDEYVVKTLYSNRRFSAERNKWRQKIELRHLRNGNIYLFTEISMLKKTYLRDILGNKSIYFVKKDTSIPLGDVKIKYNGFGLTNYINLLKLHDFPRTEWRQRIKEYQYVVSLLTSNLIDVDKIEIPQEWLDARKKSRLETMILNGTNLKRKKLKGEIIGKVADSLDRYVSNKHCKFVPTTIQMQDAHKIKVFFIYGSREQEPLFQKLYSIVKKDKVRFIIFCERELKNLEKIELHNWMEISKFMKGNHKIYRRIVTAYLIKELQNKYESVFRSVHLLDKISTPLANKIKDLNTYVSMYHKDGENDIYKAMLEVAQENNLFDSSIYDVYKEIKTTLSKLSFLNPLFNNIRYGNDEEMIPIIRDLFKYNKERINFEHYALPLNDEEKEEVNETLIEEII